MKSFIRKMRTLILEIGEFEKCRTPIFGVGTAGSAVLSFFGTALFSKTPPPFFSAESIREFIRAVFKTARL